MAGKRQVRAREKTSKPLRVAVCMDTRDQWGRERMVGCRQYAQNRNWQLHLIRQDNESIMTLARTASPDFDGTIVFDCPRPLQEALRKRSKVCVEAGERNLDLADAAVFMDDVAIVRMETEHLRSVGFEYFGYCGIANNLTSDRRVEHFMRHTDGAGYLFKDSSFDGSVEITPLARWLKELPKPAGVLACDDRIGERVLSACHWAGIRVPEEIGVVGIGNDGLICEMTQPHLSSLLLPTFKIGWTAAEVLERLMSGEKPKKKHLLLTPLEVVARSSTDKLPVARPSVLKALGFIHAESHRPIGVRQVADAAGVSPRTLARVFAADVGKPVHDYLTQLRMQNAKQLLWQSDLPLGEMPSRTGYLSRSAFVRMFTAQTGMPPGEYRERHKQQRGG